MSLYSKGHFAGSGGPVRLALKCGFDRGTFSLVTFLWVSKEKYDSLRLYGTMEVENYRITSNIPKKEVH